MPGEKTEDSNLASTQGLVVIGVANHGEALSGMKAAGHEYMRSLIEGRSEQTVEQVRYLPSDLKSGDRKAAANDGRDTAQRNTPAFLPNPSLDLNDWK
jgi:hypothetical protein